MEASRTSVRRPSALMRTSMLSVEHLEAVGDCLQSSLRDGGKPAAWVTACVVVNEQVRPEGGELCLCRLRRGEPQRPSFAQPPPR